MLCDSHVHVGQFNHIYYSPEMLLAVVKQLGIDRFAVSSITICEENYTKMLGELQTLIRLAPEKVAPVLWLSPAMMQNIQILNRFLTSGICWKCVKVHGGFHKGYWKPYSPFMNRALQVARQLKIPLLFHTGYNGARTGTNDSCEPKTYRKIIEKNPTISFILAHSRPVEQTISILKANANAYADTAFSPTEDVVSMVNEGLSDRILWGTDLPIVSYFYGEDMDFKQYNDQLLSSLRSKITEEDYQKLTYGNFAKLFPS